MDWAWWATFGVLGAEAGLRVGLSVRVLLRRESTGATLSWLALIMLFPLVGAGLYLLVGESRLGRRRAAREREVHERERDGGARGEDCERAAGLPVEPHDAPRMTSVRAT